jgi:amino acid transporter
MIMSVWILAGVLSLFGVLACAELGAAFPSTGDQYVFLREAYGPAAAFLYGWSLFTVARSAQVAWMSVAFSIYASDLVPFGPLVSKLLSLAVLSVFAWVNYRGLKLGTIVQNSFTLGMALGVLIIVAAALLQAPHAEHYARPGISSISLSSFGVGPDRLPAGLRRLGAVELRGERDPQSKAQCGKGVDVWHPDGYSNLSARELRVYAHFIGFRNCSQ